MKIETNNTYKKPQQEERILPKRDYERVIEMDKVYLSKLQLLLKALTDELDSLNASKEPLIYARLDVELMEAFKKFRVQEKLVKDKDMHYHNVFLPTINKELDECKKSFHSILKKAKDLLDDNKKSLNKNIHKLKDEVAFYDKLEKPLDIEVTNEIYKPLKRLVNSIANETS